MFLCGGFYVFNLFEPMIRRCKVFSRSRHGTAGHIYVFLTRKVEEHSLGSVCSHSMVGGSWFWRWSVFMLSREIRCFVVVAAAVVHVLVLFLL